MRLIVMVLGTCITLNLMAQNTDWKTLYRTTPEKQMNLVHTKLEVKFDYEKRQMPGKAWITLTPHFYATDSVVLQAKGMLIHEIALLQAGKKRMVTYSHADSMELKIKLDRIYNRGEKLVLYIDYTARPDELKTKGSAAITGAKGLYFINPDGKDSTKPIQIWTQGETEATSVWCPTIDRPNQKTTQEISMTVPGKYVSLSNGTMVKQVKNANGTRTDTWKMNLPHAPYLMFMGVGDFAVIRDKYKNIPVDYYVEKEYASVARSIYGDTPEMLRFFGKLLGFEYPWPKYAQMVGTDFVSGAMENTTATLHGAWANQNARQLADGNQWEVVVAHELFHHWFGDLVTAESWSNLTVNESFADYSEYLWMEHKYGRDAADDFNQNAMQGYLNNPGDHSKHLARFYYRSKDDMFDQVSYQKGGRILHMLRNQLGDSAFFKGLNLYLNQNKFKAAESHHVRLALEEVSGKDLNPFFNQWYFGKGHPEVQISYGQKDGRDFVAIHQTQKDSLFNLPLKIAAYGAGSKPVLHEVVATNRQDTFYFNSDGQMRYYEADADRVMLWKKTETKTAQQWEAQYNRMGSSVSRREALTGMMALDTLGEATRNLMVKALSDPFYGIRSRALRYFGKYPKQLTTPTEWALVETLARTEKNQPTRALAIDALAKNTNADYINLFTAATTEMSYTVAGAALEALTEYNLTGAEGIAGELKKDAKGRLSSALDVLDLAARPVSEVDSVIAYYKRKNGLERIGAAKGMTLYANKIMDADVFKKVLDPVFEMLKRTPAGFGNYRSTMLDALNSLLMKKQAALAANAGNTALAAQFDWLAATIPK